MAWWYEQIETVRVTSYYMISGDNGRRRDGSRTISTVARNRQADRLDHETTRVTPRRDCLRGEDGSDWPHWELCSRHVHQVLWLVNKVTWTSENSLWSAIERCHGGYITFLFSELTSTVIAFVDISCLFFVRCLLTRALEWIIAQFANYLILRNTHPVVTFH